jgi:parallel beta-helix repeat protein
MLTDFLVSPVFVMAKNICYVDKDVKDDGKGSKDEPYKKITKALDKGCKEIIVNKGTYKDSITMGKGVKIKGKSRDGVIITGKIIMKDDTSLKNLTVSEIGIDVDTGADAKIEDAKIKNAHIGIETLGNGTLTVEDTSFSGNRKAMYLQRGKNVKIIGCKVYDNSEEGIDIRANVDGIISGNEIHNNGESGIEVILGKSDLKIENNSIKKNHASGIATQFYKDANKLGGVKIRNNIISGNKSFGINCKTPSGGKPGANYWSASVNMSSNKMYDNREGNFSPMCAFGDEKMSDATKTKEEKEAEILQKKEEERQKQEEKKQEEERQKQEEELQKQLEQKKQEEKLQQQKQILIDIQDVFDSMNNLENNIEIQKQKVQNRSDFLIMLIGPDRQILDDVIQHVEQYNQAITKIEEKQIDLVDDVQKQDINQEIMQLQQQREQTLNFVQNYEDKFSIYKWILEHKAW